MSYVYRIYFRYFNSFRDCGGYVNSISKYVSFERDSYIPPMQVIDFGDRPNLDQVVIRLHALGVLPLKKI